MRGKQTIYKGHKKYMYVQQKERLLWTPVIFKGFQAQFLGRFVYFNELDIFALNTTVAVCCHRALASE